MLLKVSLTRVGGGVGESGVGVRHEGRTLEAVQRQWQWRPADLSSCSKGSLPPLLVVIVIIGAFQGVEVVIVFQKVI